MDTIKGLALIGTFIGVLVSFAMRVALFGGAALICLASEQRPIHREQH